MTMTKIPQIPQVFEGDQDVPGRVADGEQAGAVDPALLELEIDNLRRVVELGLVDDEGALARWQYGLALGAWLTRAEGQGR